MVTVPVVVPVVTRPVLLIVAIVWSDTLQVNTDVLVKSCVMVAVPPVNKAVALN